MMGLIIISLLTVFIVWSAYEFCHSSLKERVPSLHTEMTVLRLIAEIESAKTHFVAVHKNIKASPYMRRLESDWLNLKLDEAVNLLKRKDVPLNLRQQLENSLMVDLHLFEK